MLDVMEKNIFRRVIIISIFILLIMFIFIDNNEPIIKGYLFGLLVGMLTFKLLVNSSKKASNMNPASAETYAKRQYGIRMSIYFTVLLISALADYLNILATFLGLIMVKIVILISTILKWDL